MKAPKSELVSRAGVHYAGYVFSTEGIIFRETSSTDVSVDGQLELVSIDGIATGMLLGVQVKSGDSFVDSDSKVFSFIASKKHFQYWQRFCMPVIGVVYSPTLKKASWFDLTMHADAILKGNTPTTIKQKLSESNALEIGKGLTHLINLANIHYKQPVTKEEVKKLDVIQDREVTSSQSTKEDSWKRLISIFFDSGSDSEIIGDVGYRLSRYFPTVSDVQKNQFKDRLQLLTLSELNKVFAAIKFAMDRNRDDVACLILELLNYHANLNELLEKLNTEGFVHSEDLWLLEQSKEYIEQL